MSTTVKAVKDPEPDPKQGKSRAQSGVRFPYFDLDSVIEVARTMHERAGGACDVSQLATMLGYSGTSNGSFRARLSAAKMFGVIEDTDDRRLRVSARGRRIVAAVTPADETAARVEAFLAVELFNRVFNQYDGMSLPEAVGLQNLLRNEYQVVPDRVSPTVAIMLDSAEQAGFFQIAGNRTRMVRPIAAPSATITPPPQHAPPAPNGHAPVSDGPKTGGGGGDGGAGSLTGIDPAIAGLLKRLPPGGTPMTAKRRKQLIDAFTNVVAFIYPDSDDNNP